MKCTQSFATPLFNLENAISQELIHLWKRTILDYSPSFKPTSLGHNKVLESLHQFFYWKDPVIQQIAHFCHMKLAEIIVQTSSMDQATFESLIFDYQSWVQICKDGGFLACQNFPNSSWTGFLCLDLDESSLSDKNNGTIVLHDPRVNANQHQDDANSRWKWPFELCSFQFHPKPGDLIIFPSYMRTESFTYLGNKPRMMIWFSCWVRLPDALCVMPKTHYKLREITPFIFENSGT